MDFCLRTHFFSLITAGVIVYLSFFNVPQTELDTIPFMDKITHLCMYGGLSIVLWGEYLLRVQPKGRRYLIASTVVFPIIMGGCIEILQSICTENRTGDWYDFLTNSLGVAIAWLIGRYVLIPLQIKKRQKPKNKPTHLHE